MSRGRNISIIKLLENKIYISQDKSVWWKITSFKAKNSTDELGPNLICFVFAMIKG